MVNKKNKAVKPKTPIMKKAHFRSALFFAIIALSICSYIFLQSQKSTTPTLSEIPKVEESTEAEDTTGPILQLPRSRSY